MPFPAGRPHYIYVFEWRHTQMTRTQPLPTWPAAPAAGPSQRSHLAAPEGDWHMGIARRNPAVYAGLAGTLALASPVSASALTIYGREIPSGDPGVAFVSGAVMGAFCATCVTLVATHAGRRRAAALSPAASERSGAAAGAPREATHAGEAAPDVPIEPAGLVEVDADVTADELGGRHVRRKGMTGSIYLPDLDEAAGSEALGRAMEERRRKAAAGGSGHLGTDLEEAAQRYVHGLELGRRMASRARGVASVLSERLESTRMDGIPVIERADGTVADVGESWWDDAMREHHVAGAEARVPGADGVEEGLADNSAALFTAQTFEEAQAAHEVWARAHEAASVSASRGEDSGPTAPVSAGASAQAGEPAGVDVSAQADGPTGAGASARDDEPVEPASSEKSATSADPAWEMPGEPAAPARSVREQADGFDGAAPAPRHMAVAVAEPDEVDRHVEELVWQEMSHRSRVPRHAAAGPRHMATVGAETDSDAWGFAGAERGGAEDVAAMARAPRHAGRGFGVSTHAAGDPAHSPSAPAHAAQAPMRHAPKPRRRFRHAAADPHDYLRVIDGTGPIARHGIREQ